MRKATLTYGQHGCLRRFYLRDYVSGALVMVGDGVGPVFQPEDRNPIAAEMFRANTGRTEGVAVKGICHGRLGLARGRRGLRGEGGGHV